MDAFVHFRFLGSSRVRITEANGHVRIQIIGALPTEHITIEIDDSASLYVDPKLKEKLQ